MIVWGGESWLFNTGGRYCAQSGSTPDSDTDTNSYSNSYTYANTNSNSHTYGYTKS